MKDKSVSDIRLLPCPFCGGEAEVAWHCGHGYVAGCKDHMNCKTRGAYRIDEMSATEGWNRRAPGWIKFSDRMPDSGCYVYEANTGRVLYAVHCEWEASDWNCTHWMPEPEGPKEGANG